MFCFCFYFFQFYQGKKMASVAHKQREINAKASAQQELFTTRKLGTVQLWRKPHDHVITGCNAANTFTFGNPKLFRTNNKFCIKYELLPPSSEEKKST